MTKRQNTILAAGVLAGLLMSAAPARATHHDPMLKGERVEEAAGLLAEFESSAADLWRMSGTLESLTRSSVHWTTHGEKLTRIKDQVNSMAGILAELETIKDQASPLQQQAIAAARRRLTAVASRTSSAISALNERRNEPRPVDYNRTLAALNADAGELFLEIDAIIDYKSARMRFVSLDPPPNPASDPA